MKALIYFGGQVLGTVRIRMNGRHTCTIHYWKMRTLVRVIESI